MNGYEFSTRMDTGHAHTTLLAEPLGRRIAFAKRVANLCFNIIFHRRCFISNNIVTTSPLCASVQFLNLVFIFQQSMKEKNFCRLRVRVAQRTRRRISSAPRTDEGFINRVTDKRVGRWDFRSFGSLSQPTAEIFFRFVLIFLPLKCSRHTRQ